MCERGRWYPVPDPHTARSLMTAERSLSAHPSIKASKILSLCVKVNDGEMQ
jgi:hypothetical protein